jgi:hypothetical protein
MRLESVTCSTVITSRSVAQPVFPNAQGGRLSAHSVHAVSRLPPVLSKTRAVVLGRDIAA